MNPVALPAKTIATDATITVKDALLQAQDQFSNRSQSSTTVKPPLVPVQTTGHTAGKIAFPVSTADQPLARETAQVGKQTPGADNPRTSSEFQPSSADSLSAEEARGPHSDKGVQYYGR